MGDVTAERSPVEVYLGELFDQLAGLGTAGRQLLVETEDHLSCAVTDLQASGMARQDAERAAIERLGPPDRLASELRSVTTLPWSAVLARLIGAAWVIAAVGLVSFGGSGILALGAGHLWGRGAIAADPPDAHYAPARCAYLLEYYPQVDGNCRNASIAHHYEEELRNRFAAGVVGVIGAATFACARRGRRLRRLRALTNTPPSGMVAAIAATAFGLVSALGIGLGLDDFAVGRPWGAWSAIVSGAAMVPAFAWFANRTLREVRTISSQSAPAVAHS